MFSVLYVVALLLLPVLVRLVLQRRARGRAEKVEGGGQVRLPARVSVGTGRFRGGRVLVSPVAVVWAPRGGGAPVDLQGAAVLGIAPQPGLRSARPTDALLRLRHADRVWRLLLVERDAELLQHALGALPPGPPSTVGVTVGRPPRLRWWPWVFVGAALAWGVCWTYLGFASTSTTAIITAGDGQGSCDVTYTTSAGATGGGSVDCNDQAIGTRVPVWVLPVPFRGAPIDSNDTPLALAIMGVVIATPGVAALVWRRRRRGADGVGAPWPTAVVALPPLEVTELQLARTTPAELLARLEPFAARQVPSEGWTRARRPAGAGWRPTTIRILTTTWLPLVLVALAALLASGPLGSAAVLATGPTTVVEAVSTGEVASESFVLLPAEVTVTYRDAAGVEHRAAVDTTRDLPAGERVTVRASVDHPGRARLVGEGDGHTRAVVVAGIGSVLVLGLLLASVVRALGFVRALRRARATDGRPGLALLTADPRGDPLVLLVDPFQTPALVRGVPLERPLPHAAFDALAGSGGPVPVRVHGGRSVGDVVVLVSASEPAWMLRPAGPTTLVPVGDLPALLDPAGELGGR